LAAVARGLDRLEDQREAVTALRYIVFGKTESRSSSRGG
jgi:hypothetical protein